MSRGFRSINSTTHSLPSFHGHRKPRTTGANVRRTQAAKQARLTRKGSNPQAKITDGMDLPTTQTGTYKKHRQSLRQEHATPWKQHTCATAALSDAFLTHSGRGAHATASRARSPVAPTA